MSYSSEETPSSSAEAVSRERYHLRKPRAEDAVAIHSLVTANPPLDPNSLYCNLLQCSHFADTCVVCECDGELHAFMTGYIKPGTHDELFVWQMAVAQQSRGQALSNKMLNFLVTKWRPRFIETTITETNQASAAVFLKFAAAREAEVIKSTLFDHQRHFGGHHDSEILYRIGPLSY